MTICLWTVCFCGQVTAQQATTRPFLSFAPADTLHKGRFWAATGVTGALYTGSVIALNEAWYKQFPRSSFHTFDDWHEWMGMDKAGHVFTTYFESLWAYKIARWTGMQENAAIWTGIGTGLLFQTTVEVLDGFSAEWGFSLGDMGFNLLGSSAFFAQQKGWGEQRIAFKVSSTPPSYPTMPVFSIDGQHQTTLQQRARQLFGTGYAERFLKDYNAQTIWLSVNVHAFMRNQDSRFPRWLNIAVGYGAENLYGGFENGWNTGDARYDLPASLYPRYRQWYLGPDIDFTKIPARSPFVRTMLGMLNVFKIPGPVLEYNRVEGMRVRVRW